jgi:hypothetical protein
VKRTPALYPIRVSVDTRVRIHLWQHAFFWTCERRILSVTGAVIGKRLTGVTQIRPPLRQSNRSLASSSRFRAATRRPCSRYAPRECGRTLGQIRSSGDQPGCSGEQSCEVHHRSAPCLFIGQPSGRQGSRPCSRRSVVARQPRTFLCPQMRSNSGDVSTSIFFSNRINY